MSWRYALACLLWLTAGAALAQPGPPPGVRGPASSGDSNVPLFDGTTGKLLKDSGLDGGLLVIGPGISTENNCVTWGASANEIQDFGAPCGSGTGTVTSVASGTGLTGGPITGTGTLSFASIAANRLLGALTATTPSALAVPSCSTATSALTWTSGTGFGCNSISPGSGTVTSLTSSTGIVLSPTTITGTGSIGLATIANGTLLGNYSGLTQAPGAVTVLTALANSSGCSGNSAIAYKDPGGSGTFSCTTGSIGQVLQLQSSAGQPQLHYQTPGKFHASYQWPSNQNVAADTIPLMIATEAGTITSVSYLTGGGTPSFTLAITIGGVNVTSCNGLTVNSASQTTTTCTAANALASGNIVAAVITAPSGTPNDALVQINYTVP